MSDDFQTQMVTAARKRFTVELVDGVPAGNETERWVRHRMAKWESRLLGTEPPSPLPPRKSRTTEAES